MGVFLALRFQSGQTRTLTRTLTLFIFFIYFFFKDRFEENPVGSAEKDLLKKLGGFCDFGGFCVRLVAVYYLWLFYICDYY